MKIQIKVPEIHCSGCVALIQMSLEEEFENVKVDQESKSAEFESKFSAEETKLKLDGVFSELKDHGYSYQNLSF